LQRPWVFVASLLTLVLIAAATRNSAVLLAPLVLVQVLLVVRATRALGTGNLTGWVVYLGAVIASLVFIILGISYLRSGDETRYAAGVMFLLFWGWVAYKLLAPAVAADWKARSTSSTPDVAPAGESIPPEPERLGKHEAG